MRISRKTTLTLSLLLLPVAALLGNGCANGMFYQPQRAWHDTPARRGIRHEELDFRSKDGTALSGWWLPAVGEAKGTVVHCHGNAENMSTHVRFAEWLPAAGYNLFVFDYRGYGRSGGTPSRRGIAHDTAAALLFVAQRPDVDPARLVVWGQSLGGTAALQGVLLSGVAPRGLLIDSTFQSHRRIAGDLMRRFPWFLQPLRLFLPALISGGYDADDALRALPPLPVVFLHGEADRIVPADHSRALFELAREPKELWLISGADHTEAVFTHAETLRPRILDFFRRVMADPPPAP